MALDDLSEEGKEALLNFVLALARRQARLDYAEEQAKVVPDGAEPVNSELEQGAKRP